MTRRWVRRSASVGLSVLAALGTIFLVVALAGFVFDVRVLVFKSGSMSPTIDAGALAFARSVDAPDLKVGDIVSVPVNDSRVTHRVAEINHTGNSASLVLKGDANTVTDADPYSVKSADRVFLHLSKLGYVSNALAGPLGSFFGGILAATLLYLIFRPGGRSAKNKPSASHATVGGSASSVDALGEPKPVVERQARGERRGASRAWYLRTKNHVHFSRIAVGGTVALLILVLGGALTPLNTMATFSDTAIAKSGYLTASTSFPPIPPLKPTLDSPSCAQVTAGNGKSIRVRWIHSDAGSAGYQVVVTTAVGNSEVLRYGWVNAPNTVGESMSRVIAADKDSVKNVGKYRVTIYARDQYETMSEGSDAILIRHQDSRGGEMRCGH